MKTRFIAEIGSNHNQDFNRAIKLIEEAKKIGCWGVKFQLFDAEKLYAPGFADVEELKKRELPIEWLAELSEHCKRLDIQFGCTPFTLEAVNELKDFVDFFKISSFDIYRTDLIKSCALAGKQELMISTGLAYNANAIIEAINTINLVRRKAEVILLHCVSKYPTGVEESEIKKIKMMYIKYNQYSQIAGIGYSDHTANPVALIAAWKAGASVFECHFDLTDMRGIESGGRHCWSSDNLILPMNIISESENLIEKYDYEDCLLDDFAYKTQAADPSDGMRPLKQARC